MALRIILNTLDPEAYQIAFVTNPDMTFPQILREVVGQLQGTPCTLTRREALLEEFNKLLFEAVDAGKRTLVFIDEGNALRSANLQSLRLLTNMQEDDRNLFTIVLAGQTELAKRLEHPRARNLYQRIGVYCRIQKMETRALLKDYVEHRMELAGCTRPVFTEEAYDALWEYSEEGIPRLVNKMCKLALKAGETNEFEQIGPEVVAAIGGRFRRMVGGTKRETKKKGTKKRAPRKRPKKAEAPPKEAVAPPKEAVAPPKEVVEAPPKEVVEAPPKEAVAPPKEVVEAPPAMEPVPSEEGIEEEVPQLEEVVSTMEEVASTMEEVVSSREEVASTLEPAPSTEGDNGDRGIDQLREAIAKAAFSEENPFVSTRPVDMDGNIVYRRRRYFVDSELAGQDVTVSELDGQLFIRVADQIMMLPLGAGQPEAETQA
jgi:general secretion pathway protein A